MSSTTAGSCGLVKALDETYGSPRVATVRAEDLDTLAATGSDWEFTSQLLTTPEEIDEVSWVTRARIADRGCLSVRVTDRDVTRGRVTTPTRCAEVLPDRVVVSDETASEVWESLSSVWETASEVDWPAKVGAVVREELGGSTWEVICRLGDCERARRLSPSGLLVWAAAVSEAPWSDVVNTAQRTGLCSRGTLQRRLGRLQDEDLVQTIPMERETRGGRPNRLAVREHVDGAERPPEGVVAALPGGRA